MQTIKFGRKLSNWWISQKSSWREFWNSTERTLNSRFWITWTRSLMTHQKNTQRRICYRKVSQPQSCALGPSTSLYSTKFSRKLNRFRKQNKRLTPNWKLPSKTWPRWRRKLGNSTKWSTTWDRNSTMLRPKRSWSKKTPKDAQISWQLPKSSSMDWRGKTSAGARTLSSFRQTSRVLSETCFWPVSSCLTSAPSQQNWGCSYGETYGSPTSAAKISRWPKELSP